MGSNVNLSKTIHFLCLISLACVSSETYNLQRVFRPVALSLIQAIRVCAAPKGMVFQPFWSEKGYQVRPFWSERGYGLWNLVLNWVCFLEELATS